MGGPSHQTINQIDLILLGIILLTLPQTPLLLILPTHHINLILQHTQTHIPPLRHHLSNLLNFLRPVIIQENGLGSPIPLPKHIHIILEPHTLRHALKRLIELVEFEFVVDGVATVQLFVADEVEGAGGGRVDAVVGGLDEKLFEVVLEVGDQAQDFVIVDRPAHFIALAF